ncbi:MAG: dihydrofolate reductase [Porticoccaceae bacterium]|jgi:dihydrofolate reductase
MKLSLIVAVSRNGVIGIDNQLPWHLPEDLKYFKSVTMGKPLIMGRKTYDSIGRPLPGRTNIVVTRDPSWQAPGVDVAQSLEVALQLGQSACEAAGADEIMVIGGEQIYRMTLPAADRLYLTQVDAEVEGDAFFPEVDFSQWQQISEQLPELTDTHPYRFLQLDRI